MNIRKWYNGFILCAELICKTLGGKGSAKSYPYRDSFARIARQNFSSTIYVERRRFFFSLEISLLLSSLVPNDIRNEALQFYLLSSLSSVTDVEVGDKICRFICQN